MRTTNLWILLTAATFVASRPLAASCPRTGGEKARRIVPSILLWPAAPFILSHRQSQVAMPSAGARVRVSHDVDGRTTFTEGLFVSAADSVLRLIGASGDTVVFPYADARCLQVHRTSRKIGAAVGLMTGFFTGAAIGMGAGAVAFSDDGGWGPALGGAFGGYAGTIVGPIVGAARGASAWDIAWERGK
ncbi:hypothetical protein [Gemmatimonas sp.]|jgi:hypothetical protein|uniref:hypothetical protein n=1 Tax=Gemmatimonas sp. TaxID=1962908 RepID=UPI0037BF78BE